MPRVGEPFNPRNRFVGLWLPDSLARFRGISHGAKLLYARMCWHIDEYTGECCPDTNTLADGIAMQLRQAMTYLKELQTKGLIKVIRRGLGQTNCYEFLWHDVFSDNPVRRAGRHAASRTSDMQNPARQNMQVSAPHDLRKTARHIGSLEEMPLEEESTAAPGACSWCHGRGELGTGSSKSQCGVCRGTGRARQK